MNFALQPFQHGLRLRIHALRLLFLVFPLWTWTASALITQHGREPLNCGWLPEVAALIHHPARVGGEVGPLAPSARFYFSGDARTFNALLTQYAALTDQERVHYVAAAPGPAHALGEGHDFELSINLTGKGFFILLSSGAVKLEEVKLTRGVDVELYPGVGRPLDPVAREALAAEERRVRGIIANWRQTAPSASPPTERK